MALYGAAKAPAVPKNSDGSTEADLTDNSAGTSGGDTVSAIAGVDGTGSNAASAVDTRDAIATLAAKLNAIMDHLNDGR